jgi:hypothetical protein
VPLYTAGQKIRAAELNALPQMYFVETAVTKNNSAVFSNVTGLAFPAAINSRYFVELFIYYSTNTTRDIQFQWTYPTGATASWGADGTDQAAASNVGDNNRQSLAISGIHAFAGDSIDSNCTPTASFLTDATHPGTIQLQFTQKSAGATDTIIRAGSCMRVTQLA